MAGNDIFLWQVPSDANSNDVRLRDPTTAGVVTGSATTSQAQTIASSGSFTALGGVTGDAATSQAQTISASGTAAVADVSGTATTAQAQSVSVTGSTAVADVSGTGALSQAQTIAGAGSVAVASVSGTITTSQAQTIVSSGSASPASVSGTASTSQAETVAGSGSFAGAGVVTGDAATSQAQTVISTGQFTAGQSSANQWYGYLTSYELLNKKKKHKQIEIETPEEVLVELPKVAPIEAPDEAKRLLKVIQKKAQREGKAIADAFVTRLIEQAKIRAFEELRVLKQIENQRLEWLAEEDEEDAILLLL